jgi:hypothetical protein
MARTADEPPVPRRPPGPIRSDAHAPGAQVLALHGTL